jgi:hypothetical protein
MQRSKAGSFVLLFQPLFLWEHGRENFRSFRKFDRKTSTFSRNQGDVIFHTCFGPLAISVRFLKNCSLHLCVVSFSLSIVLRNRLKNDGDTRRRNKFPPQNPLLKNRQQNVGLFGCKLLFVTDNKAHASL